MRIDRGRPPHADFRYADPHWYESFGRYRPGAELIGIARAVLPETWRIQRQGVWFGADPGREALPDQGWKIHVSATPQNCGDVLRVVARTCAARDAPFKFALDRQVVHLMTSKGWPAEAASKVITVYPRRLDHFTSLLDELYPALAGFDGPYVLSDRRYKDSRVLYYRYGGIRGRESLTVRGDFEQVLVSPDGDRVTDRRLPYWSPPGWASDPFGEEEDVVSESDTLHGGRYEVEQALGTSNAGGVYRAEDRRTGRKVVIKEARPYVAIDEWGRGAIARLETEHRLLCALASTGVTPAPIDLFRDWEHLFLVEEHIEGVDLGHFTIAFSPLLRVSPGEDEVAAYRDRLVRIWLRLARAVAAVHARGVVIGDVSLRNVMVVETASDRVRLVDLEAAYEPGVDPPSSIGTPGFVGPAGEDGRAGDVYGLGSVMLGSLFVMNNLLDLDPGAAETFVVAGGAELGVSEETRRLVLRCMSERPQDRPSADSVAEALAGARSHRRSARALDVDDVAAVTAAAVEHIRASADFDRSDRLFPADPAVFHTNPLNVAYGATGVAYALNRISSDVPDPVVGWILSRPSLGSDALPPGLYVGLSGIAWTLLELGHHAVAHSALESASRHALLWEAANVFYGAAGHGLACLRFYLEGREPRWLDGAVAVGEWLLRSKRDDEAGSHWPDEHGDTWLGYARGASGIALFLLYLSRATGDRRFLDAGRRALAFDLARAQPLEGHLSIPRGVVGAPEPVLTHYWLDGSAGVLTALVRYWKYTDNEEYRKVLERLAPDCHRSYTVFPSLFLGLSGLGNALLDLYQFTEEPRYLEQARRAGAGVLRFKVKRPEGAAFPGEQLYRLSTDFATGSAGIASFLHRLERASTQPDNFNLLLDEFFEWDADPR